MLMMQFCDMLMMQLLLTIIYFEVFGWLVVDADGLMMLAPNTCTIKKLARKLLSLAFQRRR
jgi:hypothetical protein